MSEGGISDDLSSLCLELEEAMMTNYTENILRGDIARSKEMKDDVRNNDRQRQLGQCEEKSPLIAEMAREVGWRNLWDACLSFGLETHDWVAEAVPNHEPPWQRPISLPFV